MPERLLLHFVICVGRSLPGCGEVSSKHLCFGRVVLFYKFLVVDDKGEHTDDNVESFFELVRAFQARHACPLPWDTGVMAAVFGPRDRPFPWLDPDVILNVQGVVPVAPVVAPAVDLGRAVPSGAMEAREGMALDKEDESAREKVISKWMEITLRRFVVQRRTINGTPPSNTYLPTGQRRP